MTARATYQDSSTWQLYQPYFPESMRLTAQTMPREEWWSWRGLDVHLDQGTEREPLMDAVGVQQWRVGEGERGDRDCLDACVHGFRLSRQ